MPNSGFGWFWFLKTYRHICETEGGRQGEEKSVCVCYVCMYSCLPWCLFDLFIKWVLWGVWASVYLCAVQVVVCVCQCIFGVDIICLWAWANTCMIIHTLPQRPFLLPGDQDYMERDKKTMPEPPAYTCAVNQNHVLCQCCLQIFPDRRRERIAHPEIPPQQCQWYDNFFVYLFYASFGAI